jgi:5-methylcytosine-specific restriction endonuclease McrA
MTRWSGGRSYGLRSWRRLAASIIARDRACQIPGCDRPAEVADHIVPKANGGSDHPSNLRGICLQHHQQRSGAGNKELTMKGCDKFGMPLDPAHPWRLR